MHNENTKTFTSRDGVRVEAKYQGKKETSWKMFIPLTILPIFTIAGFAFSIHNHLAVQSANRQKIEATHSVQRIYEDWQ